MLDTSLAATSFPKKFIEIKKQYNKILFYNNDCQWHCESILENDSGISDLDLKDSIST
jgi:hypothetical protein